MARLGERRGSDVVQVSRAPTGRGDRVMPALAGPLVRYSSAEGVPGAVRALLESTDGRIWIGSWHGLTQFDGRRFTTFTKAQGIPPSIALAEDRDGSIWIGTLDDGALRFARDGFIAYAEEDGLAWAHVRHVFETPKGEIYVVTINQRIHRLDGGRFTAVRPRLHRDVGDLVNAGSALRDHLGDWWVPGGAGLYRFPPVDDITDLERVADLHDTPRAGRT